ncbi:hypothetical protein F5B22DRAFT_538852 [Xylaria bambusicola]|uniref:uncharacterized protein n=1 Tax=Xylaria bambusicola TaxID=326684 RepID=UPI0020072B48|nr:uncharacterized protein F5B22DRAFT_538852 [Xylaria bambusicola]KAI0505141.1 hypothetical protein F5B22DRAFT_538852 [Xylaria bambusicola]
MKFSTLALGLVAVLTPLTAAWSKEDREIFRVRDELATHEGPDVTFYDFLGITPSASQDDINKAYKRKSRALHPDKVRQQIMAERTKKNKAKGVKVTKAPSQSQIKAAVKKAGERQARLGIVTNVLRGPGRDRYDHFLKNGFPTWKGTEYYYSRYRPGLGTVLFGVLLVGGGGFHYLALYMSWRRQREFVDRYIKFARNAAWGDNFAIPGVDAPDAGTPPPQTGDENQPPIAMNRKQRRWQEKETRKESAKEGKRPSRAKGRSSQQASGSATPVPQAPSGSGPTGAKKRVVAENGKILVVDSLGDVYLEQEDADGNVHEFLLDPAEFPPPTIKDTALFKFPGWFYGLTVGRAVGQSATSTEETEIEIVDNGVDEDGDSEDAAQRTPSTDSADDFELLEKSVEDLPKPKATGSQAQSGKAKKRNNKKR